MRLPRNVRKQVDLGQAVPPSSVPIIPESCFALNNLTSVTDLKIEHGDEAGQNHGQNHGHVLLSCSDCHVCVHAGKSG